MKRLLLIAFSAFAALVATASSLKADADYQYAARPLDFGDILLEIDEARDVNISVRNEGSVAMANIHYRLTIDGVESE